MSSEQLIPLIPYLIPLVLLQLALMVISLVSLWRAPRVRWFPKPLWVLVVVVINLIGPAVYLLAGRGGEDA